MTDLTARMGTLSLSLVVMAGLLMTLMRLIQLRRDIQFMAHEMADTQAEISAARGLIEDLFRAIEVHGVSLDQASQARDRDKRVAATLAERVRQLGLDLARETEHRCTADHHLDQDMRILRAAVHDQGQQLAHLIDPSAPQLRPAPGRHSRPGPSTITGQTDSILLPTLAEDGIR